MDKITKLILDNKYVKQIKNGYPLIMEKTVVSWQSVGQEGTILDLYSKQGDFVAKAYYGRQNKGYGWVLTREKDETVDTSFFSRRISKAINKRQSFEHDVLTTAYRIFNGEGDGVGGLTIDYLDGHYLITWYSLGIYQFRDSIINALKEQVNFSSIYEKKRFEAKGTYIADDDFVTGERPEFPLIVLENGVKFAVYLNDGPMIGFFLDQKDVRQRLRAFYVKNKKVLNTFSYTGAFSVYSALGGAAHTTSVDLANRSLPRTRELFEINGIDPDGQTIIVEDVFNYFKYAVRKQLLFDVVILDPPSFARSKKRTFSVYKDYTTLLEEAVSITEKGGTIVASTNYANADMKWFKACVDKAFRQQKAKYELQEVFTLPEDFAVDQDFPEGNYLKVLFIRKL